MWIRALSLFLVIQVLSFGVWTAFYQEDVQATGSMDVSLHQSTDMALNEVEEALLVDFSARSLETDYESLYETPREQIETVLNWLPSEHRHSVEEVTLNYHSEASRGLGGQGKVILGSLKMDSSELSSVFIHEVGHNVAWSLKAEKEGEPSAFYDGKTRLNENDPIVTFFNISWQDSETQKPTASARDFVSGYARTNAHEDFAESYNYYINQGLAFLSLAENNEALKSKYEFLRDQVFDGMEFETGKPVENQNFRPWDVTKLEMDENLFDDQFVFN